MENKKGTCAVPECTAQVYAKGYCRKHYARQCRYGDPLGGRLDRSPQESYRCTALGCAAKPIARGLCRQHYEQASRTGQFEGVAARKCSIGGCETRHYAKGYCNAHYRRWKLYGDPLGVAEPEQKKREAQPSVCEVEGCIRAAATRNMCHAHYQRFKRHGDPLGGRPRFKQELPERCQVEGCDDPPASRGWCKAHYGRWRKYGDPEAPLRRAPDGTGWRGLNNDGYVVIKKNGTTRLEHRLVMEEILGRPLRPFENVHHKRPNSKADNRPENLELWVRVQPSGQRLEDILDWMVEYYPGETRAALDRAQEAVDGSGHLGGTR